MAKQKPERKNMGEVYQFDSYSRGKVSDVTFGLEPVPKDSPERFNSLDHLANYLRRGNKGTLVVVSNYSKEGSIESAEVVAPLGTVGVRKALDPKTFSKLAKLLSIKIQGD